ncbi:dynamin family protein [Herpetosiphon llansteffanensis]|uniref:dynamin family protein n=1 Tax=Herpetosiphon llansteffanensis TaxID=2094568 RepID=UPI000D7BBA9B|nr:dynamin family protein [Herpetosiphon llansteffanensis]
MAHVGAQSILGEREAELRATEQSLFDRLHNALEQFGADVTAADAARLREATEQLAELFLIVVAGEFNAGKSSFINALLGDRVLPEGVTPTTDRINILRFGEQPDSQLLEDFLLLRTHPAPLLGDLNIVDTPGTNAIIRRHEELTKRFVPRSDLVLFITSADRPFTESERTFLEHIREWGKKIILIVNKIDILDEKGRNEVLEFVRSNATNLLGSTPMIFAVSARSALRARENDDPKLWDESGFNAMEEYLLRTLDQGERVRLKLLNPLGVGQKLATTYRTASDERLQTLSDDIKAINNIEGQIQVYKADMQRDFTPRIAQLENLIHEFEQRGHSFFDEQIRIGRARDLIKKDLLEQRFRDQVVGDLDADTDRITQQIIDWLIERNLKLWQDVNAYIDRRQLSRHNSEMVGNVGQNFNYNRQSLIDSVGRSTNQIVQSYNRDAEAKQLAMDLQGTIATTALTGVGAVGFGALFVILAHGALLDFTGISLSVLAVAGGAYLIPAKRAQAKREFHKKVSELRDKIVRSLSKQVYAEIDQSIERVTETVAPYTRFVKYQNDQLQEARNELAGVEQALARLRGEIESL